MLNFHIPYLLRPATMALFLVVSLCQSTLAQEDDSILVLGRVSNNPNAHYDRLKPLLDYVVDRMGDVGIRDGRILMARDGQAMVSYLRQGRVDWVTETANGAITMMNRTGAKLLLRGWRGGRSDYHTLFVVRGDSGIDDLTGLRGRSIGFQHPMSTSGYMVPAGMLLEAGMNVAILLSPLDRPNPDFVGYAFTGSALNSVAWVHKRVVDAAAISDQDWDEQVAPVPDYASDLRVIARSPAIPRSMELVRDGLNPVLRDRLRAVLLGAADDPAAGTALDRYFGTDRFTVPDDALLDQIERLGPLFGRVRDELE